MFIQKKLSGVYQHYSFLMLCNKIVFFFLRRLWMGREWWTKWQLLIKLLKIFT